MLDGDELDFFGSGTVCGFGVEVLDGGVEDVLLVDEVGGLELLLYVFAV